MRNKLLLILLLLMVVLPAPAQKRRAVTIAADTVKPYGRMYIKPEFPGCDSALTVFIKKSIRYPDAAREQNVAGKVLLRFLVDEKGSISRVQVVRGIGSGCDEEAKRMVKAMPAWIPAMYKNKPVSVVEVLPIVFELRSPDNSVSAGKE